MSQYKIEFRHFSPLYWGVWLLLGLGWCVAQLPFSTQLALGKGLGRLIQFISPSRRRITRRNIELCFPELTTQERRQFINESFVSLGMGFVEIALAYWGSSDRLAPLCHIKGLDKLEQLRQEGKGVMIMAAHMTSLELCLRLFSETYPVAAMYKPAHNDLFEIYSYQKRARFLTPIPNKKLRTFLQHLKKGGAAFYLPDQHYGVNHSIFAPFFGIQTSTIAHTPDFVKLTHSAVTPVLFGREADGYHIEIMPALEFPTDDPVKAATLINYWIKQNIRKYPGQYLWQHRRFKHRPEGESPIYEK